MDGLTRLQINGFFINVLLIDPSLQQEMARRQILQFVDTIGLGGDEIRSVEHQNNAPHVFVDFTIQFHYPGLFEDLDGRAVAFAITTQVESLRLGVREYVMVKIVSVWKRHACSDLNREKGWAELRSQLQNLVG